MLRDNSEQGASPREFVVRWRGSCRLRHRSVGKITGPPSIVPFVYSRAGCKPGVRIFSAARCTAHPKTRTYAADDFRGEYLGSRIESENFRPVASYESAARRTCCRSFDILRFRFAFVFTKNWIEISNGGNRAWMKLLKFSKSAESIFVRERMIVMF